MNSNVIVRRLASLLIRDIRCLTNCPVQIELRPDQKPARKCLAARDRMNNFPRRFFTPLARTEVCWHCQSKNKKANSFVCSECGKLQDIAKECNYFELLSLPQDFDVPALKLTSSFRQLQTIVHPDKFSNKSDREKKNSADWSALINKAYKTLSQPIDRGQYLLKLKGEDMPSDNSSLDKEFLMEMMERNEEVDDATTTDDLNKLNEKIQEEINRATGELKMLFNSDSLQDAKKKLVLMKYLQSTQSNIKTKLEKLMYK